MYVFMYVQYTQYMHTVHPPKLFLLFFFFCTLSDACWPWRPNPLHAAQAVSSRGLQMGWICRLRGHRDIVGDDPFQSHLHALLDWAERVKEPVLGLTGSDAPATRMVGWSPPQGRKTPNSYIQHITYEILQHIQYYFRPLLQIPHT